MLCSLYARPSGNWERDAMDCFNLSLLSTEHAGEPSWIDGTHSTFPGVARTMDVLFRMCRTADGARTRRAAPDPGAASPGFCHARGGSCCLGEDVSHPGCSRLFAHTLCTGDSPV